MQKKGGSEAYLTAGHGGEWEERLPRARVVRGDGRGLDGGGEGGGRGGG